MTATVEAFIQYGGHYSTDRCGIESNSQYGEYVSDEDHWKAW